MSDIVGRGGYTGKRWEEGMGRLIYAQISYHIVTANHNFNSLIIHSIKIVFQFLMIRCKKIAK